MKVLRIRQIGTTKQGTQFCEDYCDPWVIIYLDDRNIQAPDAECVVVYKEIGDFNGFDTQYVDFAIAGQKYHGWLHIVQEHEFTMTQISSLAPAEPSVPS